MLKSLPYLYLLIGFLLFATSCKQETPKANLLIKRALIWTGNQTIAQSMAIKGDRIMAIGTDKEMALYQGEQTQVIDAEGNFITPGFIDSHVHLLTGGRSLLSVELRDANTQEEFIRRIADFAKSIEPGTWILEGNWDHTLWGGELPNKDWIDPYTRENPVVIYRLDGHMVLANSAALAIAGIDKNTPEVESGKIVRNSDGTPTGILKSNAMDLLLDKIPAMTEIQQEEAFKEAMNYFLSQGVTSVHDVDSLESYPIAQKLKAQDELALRIYGIKPLSKWKQLLDSPPVNDEWLRLGGLKGFVDGSLGSHTAAFKEVYTDTKNDKGFFIYNKEKLYQWISEADKANLHIMVHAIGDSAIQSLLEIYAQIIEENGPRDRRLRIEHAQHIAPEDIQRFADLQVIASMQPYHAIDDGRWAEDLIGAERIKTTYAFHSLLDAKAKVVFGSDWAVAPASPLWGIYAAVTRRTLDGQNPEGWVPEQKITVEQALTAYTKDAAYASFEEHIKGTLEPGKLADFVVLSENLSIIDPVKIKDVQVLQTYVGGKKVFDRKEN